MTRGRGCLACFDDAAGFAEFLSKNDNDPARSGTGVFELDRTTGISPNDQELSVQFCAEIVICTGFICEE